ncbi:MAG: nicotinamide mononucleotide transporter [Paludibacter sp.]|nr:nicotinamide mononucleotide transporter [Paludibacter sp.]
MIINYIQVNWIEIVGAILSLIYLYLSIKQNISLWIFGFLASAFYIVVFFESKFYADMSLQFYYLAVSIYGWINWKHGTQQNKHELPTTKLSRSLFLKLLPISLLIYGVYYIILAKFTDSTIPISDSLVGMLSVIGTWMLARKLIENWLVWIVADAIATGLFFYKELYPTAILFIIYTAMAVVGYWQWKKTM